MKLILILLFPINLFGLDISYSVADLDKKEIIESKNLDEQMVLASVSKLYTIYYVLNHADPKATFVTRILKSKNAKIENGLLKGDLILKPGGDPYLTAQNFIDLIYQLKNQGIKKITGNFIIADNQQWQTERLSSLGLEDQADNSAMGSLNFEFNRFKVDRNSNTPIPPMGYLQIKTKKLKEPGLKFKLEESSDHHETWIKNQAERHHYREEVPTRNSTMFAAHFFRYLANIHQLELPLPITAQSAEGKVISSHDSLPLYRLMELGLEYSNNIMAEMLLQHTNPSNPELASKQMLKWYQQKFPDKKYNWDKTNLENASGLTLNNQTTTKNLSLLLAEIYHDQSLKNHFLSFLSISGHSGGIARRLQSPELSYKVYGKTGSLYYVNNLAGYFRADSGKLYAFSIFMTDDEKRKILSGKNSKKVDKIRRQSSAWYQRSTQEIDKLLSSLIKKY